MGQAPNTEHRTPNAERGEVSEFDVRRSMFGVRCFLHVLAFQRIEFINIGCSVVAIDSDDEGEADGGFGDGDRKDRDHYSTRWLWLGAEAPEGDEVQVRGREHQLDSD